MRDRDLHRPIGVIKHVTRDRHGITVSGYLFPKPRRRGWWHRLLIWIERHR